MEKKHWIVRIIGVVLVGVGIGFFAKSTTPVTDAITSVIGVWIVMFAKSIAKHGLYSPFEKTFEMETSSDDDIRNTVQDQVNEVLNAKAQNLRMLFAEEESLRAMPKDSRTEQIEALKNVKAKIQAAKTDFYVARWNAARYEYRAFESVHVYALRTAQIVLTKDYIRPLLRIGGGIHPFTAENILEADMTLNFLSEADRVVLRRLR